jgi:hypothetical protein
MTAKRRNPKVVMMGSDRAARIAEPDLVEELNQLVLTQLDKLTEAIDADGGVTMLYQDEEVVRSWGLRRRGTAKLQLPAQHPIFSSNDSLSRQSVSWLAGFISGPLKANRVVTILHSKGLPVREWQVMK